jgi:hypothetical protein
MRYSGARIKKSEQEGNATDARDTPADFVGK